MRKKIRATNDRIDELKKYGLLRKKERHVRLLERRDFVAQIQEVNRLLEIEQNLTEEDIVS